MEQGDTRRNFGTCMGRGRGRSVHSACFSADGKGKGDANIEDSIVSERNVDHTQSFGRRRVWKKPGVADLCNESVGARYCDSNAWLRRVDTKRRMVRSTNENKKLCDLDWEQVQYLSNNDRVKWLRARCEDCR